MTILAFILSCGEGVPLIMWLVAMTCDTILIMTYMIGRMSGTF